MSEMGRIAPSRGWATGLGLLRSQPRRPFIAGDDTIFLAVADVFARYGIAHDEADMTAMEDLFVADATLEVSLSGPPFQRIDGRPRILDNFSAVLQTQSDQRRHCITNLVVTSDGPDAADTQAYGLVSAAAGRELQLAAACAYYARLVREDDGLWRFARLWIGMDNYSGQAPGTG
ncbi:nuclear transport factor 2 family protein [Agrobacterium rhizogenes]|nr:nuclear transport factor 2 family protein [Rhizobium rhizogenes]